MNKPAVIDDTCEITLQARRFTEQVTEAISNWWEPGEPLSRGPRRKPRGTIRAMRKMAVWWTSSRKPPGRGLNRTATPGQRFSTVRTRCFPPPPPQGSMMSGPVMQFAGLRYPV